MIRATKILFLFLFTISFVHASGASFEWTGLRYDAWNNPNAWKVNGSSNTAGLLPSSNDEVIFPVSSQTLHIFLNNDLELSDLVIKKGSSVEFSANHSVSIRIRKSFFAFSEIALSDHIKFDFEANDNDIQIRSSATHFPNDITFSGDHSITLLDDFQTKGSIHLNNATLVVNAKFIVCESFNYHLTKKNNSDFKTATIITGNVVGDDSKLLKKKPQVITGYSYRGTGKTLCSAPTPFTITAVATTDYNGFDVSCNNSSDATICVNVTGGVGPFNFSWVSGPTTPCYSGVDAGSYIVVVFDMGQGGISCFTTITVTEPTEMTLLSWTGTNPSCFGTCDATASPIIVGGVPAYTYLWSSGETSSTATMLCNGTNTVEVTDANGCIFDTTFFILIPTAVAPNVTTTNVSCNGGCDGLAVSNPSGGNGAPYSWLWSNSSVNDSITNLCAGTYSVTVTDNNGCTGSQSVTITQPPSLIVNVVSTTNLVCNGVCTGSITITSSNGTLPHTYQWFDATTGLPIAGATSATATGLCAGSYYVVVTDAGGCTFQSSNITLTQPPAINVSVSATNLTCNSVCNGILTAVASGGTGTLTVNWYNAATSALVGTGNPFSGVCAGTYFAQVVDANGCIVTSSTVTVTEPPALNIVVADTDILCSGACTGTATAVVLGGTGSLSVSWHNSPSGTTIGTGLTITGLCDGNYFATVTDANGCTLNSSVFNISEPPPLVIDAQSNTDVQCNGACDGTASFSVSGGTGSITIVWFQNPGAVPIGQTGNTATGLCPGTYFAVATDANGCTITSANQSITQPSALAVTVTPTSSECGTSCTGTASASITGGTPGYTLSWVNATTGIPIGSSANPVTGLCAGNYYLIITDANGCVDTSATFTITATIIVDGSIVGTDVTCNGYCNGFANLTPAGGSSPYTFVWFDQTTGLPIGQSTEDANGLCAGSYFVIVTDSTGCNSIPITVTINEPTVISITTTFTNATCNGVCDGSITATVNGGTPTYTLNWYNATTGIPIGQTGLTASGLCDGSYFLEVTDQNGCIINSSNITITEPTALNASISTTNVSCFGVCDGTATLTVNGGTPPYSVNWSTSANTTTVENSLCAGTFTYTITDSLGCSIGPVNFTITQPNNITATITDGTISCAGVCDGTVSVSVTGGNAPYGYSWDDPSGQTTPVASGLCAGTYNVTVTDASGCTFGPFAANVTAPTSLSVSATSTNANCSGGCNGTATAVITGGTAPITISWNDALNQNTPTANSLCAGSYTVTITDGSGCTATANVTVTTTTSPTLTLSSNNASCNGICDGDATVNIAGGTAPYTIAWSNGSSSNTISSLCAGTYTVVVTDALGCDASVTATISEPSLITGTISTTTTPCSLCTATATITPTGGSGSYSFLWSVSAGSQTTPTAINLCAGIHTVDVTDNSGCTQTFTVAISNAGAETITVDSTNASCNGICDGTTTVNFTCSDPPCNILWNDPSNQTTSTATGLCEGTYGVTVTNGSGCISSATIEVEAPSVLDANATGTDVLCNGDCTGMGTAAPTGGNGVYSYSWNDPSSQTTINAFNLCPGTYIVTVTDSIGCSDQDTISISEPTAVSFTTATNDVDCFGACNGSATAFPIGGNSPYTYQWDDPASQTTQSASGLCVGTYNVTVFDANNCTSGPQTATINEPTTGNVTVTSVNPQCFGQCNGTATATVTGGTSPYSFQWNDPFNQTTATATNLCAGTYTVVVTDANGCAIGSASITITEPTNLNVSLTSTNITCNGLCDGIITPIISGGTSPYAAVWNDPSSQTTAIASALCAGTYLIIITDANGCTTSASQSVSEPSSISANLNVTDVLCFGDCNGNASVAPTGGTGLIDVLWQPGGQTTNSISGQCPGNYLVSLTDANGCNSVLNYTINEPNELTYVTGMSPAECGVCDGSGSVSPSGGTPPYSYLWDAAAANQTSDIALNLCAGIYGVTFTDANGCSITTNVGVSNIDGETVTIATTDATCYDICNGTATMTSSCVSAPCSFAWFDVATGTNQGVSTSSITGLCPGDYIGQVINSVGCTTLVTFNLNGPDTILVDETITDLTCNGVCNGSITVNATGGTGALTLQWDAAAGGGSASTVNSLCAGTYDLIVTDATGCDDTLTYTVIEPLPITINVNTSLTFCAGTCTGVATAIVSGGTATFTYQWDDPSNQTTSSASGLCNGTYTVDITDANGCTASSAPVTINEPSPLSDAVSSTNTTCFGDCDGTATILITGGTIPYAIQWDDPANQTTSTATNLCGGTYNVTVTDANNCVVGPQTVFVNQTTDITATLTISDVTCSGLCSGSITINATGGTAPYLFSIDNGVSFQSSNLFTNLCSGAYTILITDVNGCTSSIITGNVNEPTPLDATSADFPADCGATNGAASVFPLGGTPAYTIIWSDNLLNPIGQTTNTAINLGAGIYIATVTDANGCQTQTSVTISNTNAATATATTISPTCNGDCNGSIDATITGGNAPYAPVWIPNGQTSEDITNICAGTYVLEITDAAGCISYTTFDLTEPAPFVQNVTVTDATCGQCNGNATTVVTGGTGALNIVWSNLQTGSSATGLCGGTYSYLVTDANGCNEQFTVLVNNTSGPTPIVNITTPPCSNSCNGTATVSATGGAAPYSFLWVDLGSSSPSQTNLCVGSYIVEVRDTAGCVGITAVNVTSVPALSDSMVVNPASCGICDGSAVIFVTGQTPFTFQWDAAAGSAITQSVTALCQGLYNVVVTDGNGCTDTLTALVPNVNAPTVSVSTTDITCFGSCNGSAVATGSGGTAPYTIDWFDSSPTLILGNTTNIASLCPGDYIVEITDALGCGSFTPITISQPDSLTASLNFTQDESCFNTCDGIMSAMPIGGTLPFTYTWTNPSGVTTATASGLCDGVYSVNVIDANGCTITLTDTIEEPTPIVMALDSVDASCSTIADGSIDATVTGGAGGFTYAWTGPGGFTSTSEDLSGIFFGTYILTATDINGCSLTDTIVVNALLIADANAGNDTVLCAAIGGIVLNGIGTTGANYTWTDTAGNVLSTTAVLNTTVTGTSSEYIFTVNNSGCIDSDTVTVTVNPLPPADAGADQDILLGQTVTIGGSPTTTSGNTVSWDPSEPLDDALIFNPAATPDSTTSFVVTVTDANGCVNYDTVTITVFPNIIFPNGFSPNGDGANDTWILDFIEQFPEAEVSVFNRWGQPVFYSKGYDTPWDGTYDNNPVTVGTYYYVILLNHPLFPDAFTGPLTILR